VTDPEAAKSPEADGAVYLFHYAQQRRSHMSELSIYEQLAEHLNSMPVGAGGCRQVHRVRCLFPDLHDRVDLVGSKA
jgi:hypothetical protein